MLAFVTTLILVVTRGCVTDIERLSSLPHLRTNLPPPSISKERRTGPSCQVLVLWDQWEADVVRTANLPAPQATSE